MKENEENCGNCTQENIIIKSSSNPNEAATITVEGGGEEGNLDGRRYTDFCSVISIVWDYSTYGLLSSIITFPRSLHQQQQEPETQSYREIKRHRRKGDYLNGDPSLQPQTAAQKMGSPSLQPAITKSQRLSPVSPPPPALYEPFLPSLLLSVFLSASVNQRLPIRRCCSTPCSSAPIGSVASFSACGSRIASRGAAASHQRTPPFLSCP